MKEKFLQNLKGIPFEEKQLNEEEFRSIKLALELIQQEKHKEAGSILLTYIENELKDDVQKRNIPLKMLVLSEIPDLNEEIRDLALDVMISVEENQLTLESHSEFLERIKEIKNQD